jgi:hypothetical protein
MNSEKSRTVDLNLSHQTLVDIVETYFRTMKLVLNNEEVTSITFGNLNDPSVPTRVVIKEENSGNAQVAKELQKETP